LVQVRSARSSINVKGDLPMTFTRRVVALMLTAGLLSIGAGAASAHATRTVAGGLANPRGLTVGPDGALWVAEAGSGGSGACQQGPETGQVCLGATGAISRVDPWSHRVRRVVGGLPSLAAPPGSEGAGTDATGPQDVSFGPFGAAWFTVGLGGNTMTRAQLGAAAAGLGHLFVRGRSGRVHDVADLAAYESQANPDGVDPPDSNPYSVDASNPFDVLVTDAGGNDLLRVRPWGRVSTVAVFPSGLTDAPPFLGLPPGTKIPYEAVPTGVVRAPGGGAYVGQLTGFPFPAGAANVFVVSRNGTTTVRASGLTNVVDVAVGPRGELYVLQISRDGLLAEDPAPGRLLRIDPDGTRTELAAGELQHPTGLAVTRRGDVYVADNGGSPDDGRIVRVRG
jgi:hypothetical protein